MRANRVATNLLGAVFCAALFGYALFAQYHLGLEPCPLCIFQRVAVLALGAAFLLAALLSLPRARIAGFVAVALVVFTAGAAIYIAGRHVYIQSLPAGSIPPCGANLEALLGMFSFAEVLQRVLTGSGECAKIDWKFLGLSMPAWVLAWAIALGVTGAAVNWPRRRGSAAR